MLVQITARQTSYARNKWSDLRIKRHEYSRQSFDARERYLVMGMAICYRRVIYVVFNPLDIPSAGLHDGDIFDIVDPRLSSYCVYHPIIKYSNVSYDEVSFTDFKYLGIDRLLAEPDFYERYFDGCEAEVAFVEKMAAQMNAEM